MTTVIKPISRKSPPVAGSRTGRAAPANPTASPVGGRQRVPVARTVIDLTGADQPAPASETRASSRVAPPTASPVGSPATPMDDAPTPTGVRPVLSVAEAAELLGVSEWLVLQQIRLGTLPHKRCGRRIVLSRDRLLAWLNDE